MVLLSTSDISMHFGERALFEHVSFEVNDRDILGLVGANGAGKTTLFKLITGEAVPTGGMVSRSKGLTVGYMEQHICNDSENTALD